MLFKENMFDAINLERIMYSHRGDRKLLFKYFYNHNYQRCKIYRKMSKEIVNDIVKLKKTDRKLSNFSWLIDKWNKKYSFADQAVEENLRLGTTSFLYYLAKALAW